MSDVALALIVDYGVLILFVVTFLSCLALPVPSSLMMLASGSFAATGDLSITATLIAAFAGAVLGDNTGYLLARRAKGRLTRWLAATPKRARLRRNAEGYVHKWGSAATFLSRWLVSPLGPYVNFVSGLSGFAWHRFAIWGALGEVVWVAVYVGLGYAFADQIVALATLLGNLSGLLAALVIGTGLGAWLLSVSHPKRIFSR